MKYKLSHIFEDDSNKEDFGKDLRDFIRGKIPYQYITEYDYIDDIFIKKPLGLSIISFNLKKLSKILKLDSDLLRNLRLLFNPYETYEITDISDTYNDFEEGYGIWDHLNKENLNILKTIINLIFPDLKINFNDNNRFGEDNMISLNSSLLKKFSEETNRIIKLYNHYYNDMILQCMRKEVPELLNNLLNNTNLEKSFRLNFQELEDMGVLNTGVPSSQKVVSHTFNFKYPFTTLDITAGDLSQFILMGQFKGDLREILKEMLGGMFKDINPFEDILEYANKSFFNYNAFNKGVNEQLIIILNKINK